MMKDEIRHYPGLSANDPELVTALKKIRYDLTDLQGKVSEALRLVSALSLTPPAEFVCDHCGLRFGGALRRAEHLYVSHDGPLPAHWASAEARAADADTRPEGASHA